MDNNKIWSLKRKCNRLILLIPFLGLVSTISIGQTYLTLYPDIDANVKKASSGTNYGTDTTIIASYVSTSDITRGLIKFDLSQIPADAVIHYAKLSIYGVSHSGSDNVVFIKRITANWEEGTVTWTNQPATSPDKYMTLVTTTSSTEDRVVDVTRFIKNCKGIDSVYANYGLMFMVAREAGSARYQKYGSSDISQSGKKPKLEIFYSLDESEIHSDTLYPNKDASIKSDFSTTNYGTDTLFHDRYCNTVTTYTIRSLIQFELSSIPSNAIITSAVLTLSGRGHSSGSNASYLQRITGDWTEGNGSSGVTWATQPSKITYEQISLSSTTNPDLDYEIDVKNFIQKWLNGTYSNFGLMLLLQNETTQGYLKFGSSDNSNSDQRPVLIIKYYVPYSDCRVINPDKDAYLYSRQPTTNYGNIQMCRVERWTESGVTAIFRNIAEADLSSITENSLIQYADLYLACYDSGWAYHSYPTYSYANEAYIHPVTSAWSESTVTYNSASSIFNSSYNIYVPTSTSTSQDYIIDLRPFVQKWIDNEWNNYGFLMKEITEDSYRRLAFSSSDRVTRPYERPKLEITYLPPILVEITSQNMSIFNHSLGSVSCETTNGIPPLTYEWNTGDTASYIDSIWMGKYTLTVTDYTNRAETSETYVLGDIIYRDFENAVLYGDSIVKTGAAGWTSGCVSANILKEDYDGLLKYTVKETNYSTKERKLGLAPTNDDDFDEIKYAFFFDDDDSVDVQVNNSKIGNSYHYLADDIFIIERESDSIFFYKNDTKLHSLSVSPDEELIADFGFNSTDSYFKDIKVSFFNVPYLEINTEHNKISNKYIVSGAGISNDTIHSDTSKIYQIVRVLPSDTSQIVIKTIDTLINDTTYILCNVDTSYTPDNIRYVYKDENNLLDTVNLDTSYYGVDLHYLKLHEYDENYANENDLTLSLLLEYGLYFTPDGDSNYDTLITQGAERSPEFSLKVYNSAKTLIFSTTDYSESWDGKVDGNLVPEGQYKYEITAFDETIEGYFLIKY